MLTALKESLFYFYSLYISTFYHFVCFLPRVVGCDLGSDYSGSCCSLENSCSFGLRNVFLVSVPDCWFGFFPPRFWSGNLFLIAPFPDLCLLVPLDNLFASKGRTSLEIWR